MMTYEEALLQLEDNNEFLKAYSSGDDMFYERYLKGLDAIATIKEYHEKYRKHDLRKNPEDLPKEGMIIVATDGIDYFCGKIFNRHAGISLETLLYSTNRYRTADESYIEESDLIAWKEIELFEEDNNG